MAEKVRYQELANPGWCGVHFWWDPFTKEEIGRLTKGLNKFALVIDGDYLIIYGE